MKNSSAEPLAEILKRCGSNITDDNVLAVMEIFRKHGVRNEHDFNASLSRQRMEKAVRATIPPLAGAAGTFIGGPVVGAVASATTASALTPPNQRPSGKKRIKSAITSFGVSLTGADAAQPFMEAGAQALSGTLDSDDFSWIDGNDLSKIEAMLTSHKRSYAQRMRSFGSNVVASLKKPLTAVTALVKIASDLGENVLPYSSSFTQASALALVPSSAKEKIELRPLPQTKTKSPQQPARSQTVRALYLAERPHPPTKLPPPLDELDLVIPKKKPPQASLGR